MKRAQRAALLAVLAAAAAPPAAAFVVAGAGCGAQLREWRVLAQSPGSTGSRRTIRRKPAAQMAPRSGQSEGINGEVTCLSRDPEDLPLILPPAEAAAGTVDTSRNGGDEGDESVDMVVKMQGDPEEILRKLQEAGLMQSNVVETVIMHSDKARLQSGTTTLEGRRRVKERSYFGTPLWQLILRRSSVLTVLMFMQSLSSLVLSQYEELIQANVFLALFLTMLTGTGGNAGNQSASMVIRGMSTGEINDSTMLKAVGRELMASSAIGAILAAAAFARVAITPGTDTTCATVIALCSFITVVLAISGGTLVPLVVERMGGDPAVTSSPVLATLTDIIGVIVLCVISSQMLGDVL